MSEVTVKQYKWPKTLGAMVDRLYDLDEERGKLARRVEELKTEYAALEGHIFETLPKSALEGALGKRAMASIKRTPVPTADDWDAIRRYVVKNNAWDLIQKRLSTEAVRERWNADVAVPGVGKFTRITLSLTKRKI